MKFKFIIPSIVLNIMLAILLVTTWNDKRDYKGKYEEWKNKYERQKQKADSLSNRAAIDCDQKIEKALNRSYEKDPNRPVKPALLR